MNVHIRSKMIDQPEVLGANSFEHHVAVAMGRYSRENEKEHSPMANYVLVTHRILSVNKHKGGQDDLID